MGLWIFLGIIALILIWITSIYNGLVTHRNRFKNAFAQIDVQLKRRYDLIPNLVEVAKGYMKHERETLEAVIAETGAAAVYFTRGHNPWSAALEARVKIDDLLIQREEAYRRIADAERQIEEVIGEDGAFEFPEPPVPDFYGARAVAVAKPAPKAKAPRGSKAVASPEVDSDDENEQE